MESAHQRSTFSYEGSRPLLPPAIRSATIRWSAAWENPEDFELILAEVLSITLDRRDRILRDTEGIDAAMQAHFKPEGAERLHRLEWLMAHIESDAVGVALSWTRFSATGDESVEGVIDLVGVTPAFSDREYEMELLCFATAGLIAHGARTIECDADLQNAPLIAALERLGYARRD